mmetsp:Transcript_96790/g.153227  ORF Transcript_96790/g.153227 Transcript_96790/m.153227 type:complete len:378 (+) Transcript_96790:55-1188(+)
MAPMENSVISWSDPLNFCKVLNVEVRDSELLLLVHVVGIRHAPEEAEIITSGGVPLRLVGRAPKNDDLRTSSQMEGDGHEYSLLFDCPETLQCAEDVLFSYAIGYDTVPILDLILSSLVVCSAPHSSKLAERSTCVSRENDLGEVSSACRKSSQLVEPRDSSKNVLQPVQVQQVEQFNTPCVVDKVEGIAPAASCEAFFKMVDVGHSRTVPILERRLKEVKTLSTAWIHGDMQGFIDILERSDDHALLYGALERLQSKVHEPMPARALARLLPLLQRLSQSNYEAHAVVAMRFALQAIEKSWPAVTKALRNVSTSKVIFEECQAALQSTSSFYASVKTMSRSVRISKTNGPLVPVCKKLKTSLEQALIAVGRLRGST